MQLALIADWLITYGGAETVIAALRDTWPQSPVFTTVARPSALGPLRSADIRVTRLQKLYALLGTHQLLLPLMPRAIEDIDLTGFDVVISSSHAVAKGIVPPPGAFHVCYCHTPMRYAWEMEEEYLQDFRVPRFLRGTLRRQLKRLRRWDLSTAKRVDLFIANSTETKRRIADIYGREAMVISPPVDDRFFTSDLVAMEKRRAYLAVGRLVPYKRFDLLITLANTLQLPLQIAGAGQDEERLRRMAGETVEFVGYVPDTKLPELYAHAKALLFPPYEDAGIVPLEAQACGTPVIAFGKGGALDTVRDGLTGLFFPEQSIDSLSHALKKFSSLHFSPEKLREHARAFSKEKFQKAMRDAIMR